MEINKHPILAIRNIELKKSVFSIKRKAWFTSGIFWSWFFLIIVVTLFTMSVGKINLKDMNDMGLISVMPPEIFVSLVLLTVSFINTLQQTEKHNGLLFLHMVLLIVMLFGITVFTEEVPRFNVTWRHAGIVDYVMRHHSVDPKIDAYFNWPSFFVLSAFVMEVMGLRDPIKLAFWPSVINNLLYLAPLMLILRSVTENRRIVWYGLWVFYLANWIGQDYFSPQGLNYFIYLAILGILLRSFKGTQALPWLEKLIYRVSPSIVFSETQEQKELVRGRNTSRRRRLVGALAVILAALFSVASHQLTPFAILISVLVLVLFKQISIRGLGYIIGMMVSLWLAYMAVAYLQDRITVLLGNVGQVDQALTANVTKRISGSTGHNFIIRIRMIGTLFFWGLAFLGGIRRLLRKYLDLLPVLLAVPPFFLLGLQNYGGEMILRVYFFTLPFMTFFVSGLIYTKVAKDRAKWQPLLAGLLSIVMIGVFYPSRYGNEKIDQFTRKEVDAVSYVYKVAEPGAEIAAPSPHYPISFKGYEVYSVDFFEDVILTGDVNTLISELDKKNTFPSFFIITTSQESYFHIFYNVALENWPEFEAKMLASDRFELVYSNEDARVYKFLESK